jgi:hypothetical protein
LNWQVKSRIDCWKDPDPQTAQTDLPLPAPQFSAASLPQTLFPQLDLKMSIVSDRDEEIPDEIIQTKDNRVVKHISSQHPRMPSQGQKHKFLSPQPNSSQSDKQLQAQTTEESQPENRALRLDELEKIFDLFYSERHDGFRDVQIQEDARDTCIPRLRMGESVFFQFYQSEEFGQIQ